MFRVVPDQLRISDGWVRCGRCSEVFDAGENLQPAHVPGSSPSQPPSPPLEEPVRTVADAGAQLAGAPVFVAAPEPTPTWPTAPTQPTAPVPVPVPAPTPGIAPDLVIPPRRLAVDAPLPDLPTSWTHWKDEAESSSLHARKTAADAADEAELSFEQLLDRAAAKPAPAPLKQGARPEAPLSVPPAVPEQAVAAAQPAAALVAAQRPADDSELEERVSFVRQARRQALWRGPWMRAFLALLALVLTALLTVQVAVQYRDQLAGADARLKPWLESLCEPLHCKVGVTKQIESVLIESSTFTRTRQRAYRLGFMLRNSATHSVATPALEVTLTDSQDQPLVRRVLQPVEFGAAPALAPSSDWSGAVVFSDDLAVNGRVAGYRLLAFYP